MNNEETTDVDTSTSEDPTAAGGRFRAAPHHCPVEGCKKRGKSESGILRHVKHAHKDVS